ncbi:phospholipase ABHD3 [Hetaerina americana]|uniref:phospholipase ABHD3 n=1 Tax=Hetaerina americana TaxID=62018 RepID=UPI003A7F543B
MDFVLSSLDSISELPRWSVAVILGTGFVTYYLQTAVKKPIIACSKGRFRNYLETNVPILREKYWPTVWCFESRIQTVLASVLRSSILPDINYRREILKLKDGGEVALDWMENEEGNEKSPVVIILPGLTGASQAEYVKGLVRAACQEGLCCVVFNNRGLGGVPLKTPRTYCACDFEDLSEVVDHIKSICPDAPIGATGISMGGLILGNYLAGEKISQASKKLNAAMGISVPWNVFKGSESIEKPLLNLLLNRHLVGNLCRTIERGGKHLEVGPWDLDKVLKSQTIREFDSHFTAKQFGFDTVDDYYAAATLHNKLHHIQVPMLCLSAADDPFQPYEAIPMAEASCLENVALAVTARGGHIGFMEGLRLFPLHEQYMCRLFTQFFKAMLINGGASEVSGSTDVAPP